MCSPPAQGRFKFAGKHGPMRRLCQFINIMIQTYSDLAAESSKMRVPTSPSRLHARSSLSSSGPQGSPAGSLNLGSMEVGGFEGRSEILNNLQMRTLLAKVPPRFSLDGRWHLIYSLTRDGKSMSRFYEEAAACECTVLVVRDAAKKVFGGFCNTPWKSQELYYGTAECFVYEVQRHADEAKALYVAPIINTYEWTGDNNFWMHSTRNLLAMGGGDHFAFALDDGLDKGTSGPCSTFGSPVLSGNARASTSDLFQCQYFEMWGMIAEDYD